MKEEIKKCPLGIPYGYTPQGGFLEQLEDTKLSTTEYPPKEGEKNKKGSKKSWGWWGR